MWIFSNYKGARAVLFEKHNVEGNFIHSSKRRRFLNKRLYNII